LAAPSAQTRQSVGNWWVSTSLDRTLLAFRNGVFCDGRYFSTGRQPSLGTAVNVGDSAGTGYSSPEGSSSPGGENTGRVGTG